jgi:hypothetical protein
MMKRGGGSDEEILVSCQDDMEDEKAERRSVDGRSSGGSAELPATGEAGRLGLAPPSSGLSSRRTSSSSSSPSTALPNRIGNTGRSGIEEASRERELRQHANGEAEVDQEETSKAWEVNYREAAIFLEEGQNNDKFIHHPR